MNEVTPERIHQLVESVQKSPKYAQISTSLVEHIAFEELKKRDDFAECVKAVRTRLHRVVGAFITSHIDYAQWHALFKDPSQNRLELCLRMMRLHASTAERLSFLDSFYKTCLADISPVRSILDLACGLNPLALPWMPVAQDCTYWACDVVQPVIDFLNDFFANYPFAGQAFPCDLYCLYPRSKSASGFFTENIAIIRPVGQTIAPRLLSSIQADYVLVSYPAKSLGVNPKGCLPITPHSFTASSKG